MKIITNSQIITVTYFALIQQWLSDPLYHQSLTLLCLTLVKKPYKLTLMTTATGSSTHDNLRGGVVNMQGPTSC